MKRQKVINDKSAIRALLDIDNRAFLTPYVNAETSIKEAAEKVGVPLNTMAYHTHKLAELGIISCVNCSSNKSPKQKRYRVTAQEFVIPFESTGFKTFGDMLNEVTQMSSFMDYAASVLEESNPSWGLCFGIDSNSDIELSFLPISNNGVCEPLRVKELLHTSFSAFWVAGEFMNLDFASAKNLQKDLFELQVKYQNISTSKDQKYLVFLGLTPTLIVKN